MEGYFKDDWKNILNEEFQKPYFLGLQRFVDEEYSTHQCFPKREEIFNAFKLCSFNDVNIVIIGQDPYHGEGQANGLCFSVNDGIKHPPSLINIFKELETDLGVSYPVSGNLSHWAQQGVLLLNATLTVRAHQAGSHQKKGWEQFTDEVIKQISLKKDAVIFLLWGGYAKKKTALIDHEKHLIFTSGHPSPLSANRGYWFGNQHFSLANSSLSSLGKPKINW